MNPENVVLGEGWQSQKTPDESIHTECPEKASGWRSDVRGWGRREQEPTASGTGLPSGGDETLSNQMVVLVRQCCEHAATAEPLP